MDSKNIAKTDKINGILKLLETIYTSEELDQNILSFLSLITYAYNLENCFFGIHGVDKLILFTNNNFKIDTQTEKTILNLILEGKTSVQEINQKFFNILPLKIQNQFLACLGYTQNNPIEDYKDQIIILAHHLSIAIEKNQIIYDLKTNNEKLLNNDKQKTELISTMSHELRTPMANIMGFSELLLNKDFDTATTKTYIKEIHESSLRLANLITNFLDLSRLEANSILQFNNREETELDWLAERAWEQLASLNKKHKLYIEKDSPLPIVFVDSDAILRVFINLFSNAIKFSFDQEKIICHIKQENNMAVISIIDEGIGIDNDNLEKIFERFYRVNNDQTKYISGTGLGLWITKEIIKAHGGKIWAEPNISNNSRGASIIFTLPLF